MIYRKRGSTVRWENGTLVRVTESGVAIEEGEVFRCWSAGVPPAAGETPALRQRVLGAVSAIRECVHPLTIERLIVSHGIAEHECEGRTWTEETERFHLSIVHGQLRALVDSTTRRLDDLTPIANALSRAEENERDAPPHLRLAPCVTAALLPSLPGIVQTAGGVDGYGNPIVEASGDWPSWYRPSYRMRPVRMPLNVRLECAPAEIDRDLPLAVALLAPPRGNAARVLIVDGERVYPSQVRVTRVAAIAAERVWYPYAGGSFGAELML